MAKRITANMECYDFGQAVEPGYDENTVRVYANWNNYPKQLKAIEKLNALGCPIEAEWEDEWASCDECGRYVRTSPDSYGWTRSYAEMDSELVCHECIKSDPDEYIEWLTNHPKRANTILDDSVLEATGFRQFANGLENGLHEFQASSPIKIARWLRERGVNEYLFSIDDAGSLIPRSRSGYTARHSQSCLLVRECGMTRLVPPKIAKATLRRYETIYRISPGRTCL